VKTGVRNYGIKISSIDRGGVSACTCRNEAFCDGRNWYHNAIDTADVSNVTDMYAMFNLAIRFDADLSGWDVSNVTTMEWAFRLALDFNGDITTWDVSSVTNMLGMFGGTDLFNQPIGNWDVSSVENMEDLFVNADGFNQDISNWDVSSVTNMSYMFSDNDAFNQDISNWDVSNVNNLIFMFENNTVFNQPLNNWDVSNVTDMRYMFSMNSAFNQPIGNWDVSSVQDMSYMFYFNRAFNQPIGNWDVSNVESMEYMFQGNEMFDQPIGNWDVSNVTSMRWMFRDNSAFNQDIGNWDVSAVTNMQAMFLDNTAFNQDIDGWDVSNVLNFGEMFRNTTEFNHSLGSWTINPNSLDLTFTFRNASIDCANYSKTLRGWAANPNSPDNRRVGVTNMRYSPNSIDARNFLIDTLGWRLIGDDQVDCPDDMILPVILKRFDVIAQGNSVRLEWETSVEINNKGFYVERSSDGLNWERITFIYAVHPNGAQYKYTDNTVRSKKYYYRLVQEDLDGTTTFSEIRSVSLVEHSLLDVIVNAHPNQLLVQSERNISRMHIVSLDGITLSTAIFDPSKVINYTMEDNVVANSYYVIQLYFEDGSTYVDLFFCFN